MEESKNINEPFFETKLEESKQGKISNLSYDIRPVNISSLTEKNLKRKKSKLRSFKSVRMTNSFKALEDTNFLGVLFQRVFIFSYIYEFFKNLFTFCGCFKSEEVKKSNDDEDDVIIVKRKDNFNPNILETGIVREICEIDVESGAVRIDVEDIEDDDIKDEDFIKFCNKSSFISSRYAKIFRLFETLGKFSEIIFLVIFPIDLVIKISEPILITVLCFCTPLMLIQVTCDFSKLEDKYSSLFSKFKKLSSSKDDDRVEKYNKLVTSFRNNWVYSDFVRHIDVDTETQYYA